MKKGLAALSILLTLLSVTIKAQIQKGYHGFIDAGYSINTSGTLNANWTEINTIHGYQVNHYLFVGGGVGFHYVSEYSSNDIDGHPLWKRDSSWEIPLFADLRWTILNKKVTPLIETRLGHYVTNDSGQYITIGAGCRFSLNTQALYLTASYVSSKLQYDEAYMTHYNYAYDWDYKKINESQSGVSIKIGYEF